MTDETTHKKGLTRELIRGVFMILFFVMADLSVTLIGLLAIFQFFCALIVHRPNGNVLHFAKGLGSYLAQIFEFLSYNADKKPWPFGSWPGTGPA